MYSPEDAGAAAGALLREKQKVFDARVARPAGAEVPRARMHTRLLMGLSALLLGAAGLAASFAPHELLAAAGVATNPVPVLVVRIVGALYLGFALWFALVAFRSPVKA